MVYRILILATVILNLGFIFAQEEPTAVYFSNYTCACHAHENCDILSMENDAVLVPPKHILKEPICPFCKEQSRTDPSGNCFKCYGRGKLGSWCTFCHSFVSWCIHGGGWRTCDACGGIGWIETQYKRCPHCGGKGYEGVWCTFCHAFVIWCIHGNTWRNCYGCHGKGYIGPNQNACSTCSARGWVGEYCSFCYATVMWCVHGHSPRSCSSCGGDGVK